MREQQLTVSAPTEQAAEWTVPDTTLGRYKAVITWEKDGEVLAESETLFKVAGEESVADTITSNKKVYSAAEPVNLSTRVFNQSSNLVENDLTLRITVKGKNSGAEAAAFSRTIASVNPQGSLDFADAVKAGTLAPGSYVAEADVLQDGTVLATDSAEFDVENNVSVFTGTLALPLSGDTVNAAFTVNNTGSANAAGAEITVEVFAENGDRIFTVTKQSEIAAGSSVQFEEPFSAAELAPGNYSGVLSVRYDGKRNDLAYAGFTVDPVVTTTVITTAAPETTTVTTAAETAAPAAQTTTAVNAAANRASNAVNALKTGVSGIPWYIWTMFTVSIIALAALRKRGGRKEHE
ncbi:MAG: hypothetical protein J5722_02495 [Oscillospiraceae bacterium]|nr:hypothetical protein [Oscillospiraceae bacterium]